MGCGDCLNTPPQVAQYSPSSWSMEIGNAQLGQKIQELIVSKRLSENVSELIAGGNMRGDEFFGMDALSNEVAVNLNVFGAFMENRISSNV